jgi:hypothetical protein
VGVVIVLCLVTIGVVVFLRRRNPMTATTLGFDNALYNRDDDKVKLDAPHDASSADANGFGSSDS